MDRDTGNATPFCRRIMAIGLHPNRHGNARRVFVGVAMRVVCEKIKMKIPKLFDDGISVFQLLMWNKKKEKFS